MRPQAYILHNQVTHARLLPVKASNSFTYPTLALLVSLNALEARRLDLGRGWIFGYGGLWGRIVGLRPGPYLTKQAVTIMSKLEDLLKARGHLEENASLRDAWMMTMPSFLGFEGINPLTVYFCYNSGGTFWSTVLEIHNTFGESHVHVLEVGRNEDPNPSTGYDHQWTFPREFHVSPFNDRSGFYTVSIKSPAHPPMATINDSPELFVAPKPSVRVHLYTASQDNPELKGVLKLTALLRPTHSTPLTTPSLLFALGKAPFGLLLTMSRIVFVAWKLHYQKRLDVFLRPEPLPAAQGWGADPAASQVLPVTPAGGVKWLDAGILDNFARNRVELFLRRRVQETGIEVSLVAADPSIPPLVFSPDQAASSQLTISYLSARIFTILFMSPSAQHALLLGTETERIFRVSSKDNFLDIFSSPTVSDHANWLQRLRSRTIPYSLTLPVPSSHFLDQQNFASAFPSGLVICTCQFLDSVEKLVFSIAKARIVAGQEPWKQWDRAAAILRNGSSTKFLLAKDTIGSVIREP
ncbi:hypothetical protein GALMADRAFT_224770 [Galerina marginata CBS 339.88]|uniref:DUF1365 domain-containing protein n=1 Tax=Galerina marginata (strain CBS 339.88) TaxID=685588 RepID=A0A067THF4_GALM3|nr:hypothetical protein GALMADRAFT_224770 [Galerina marginata CBS 339.88]